MLFSTGPWYCLLSCHSKHHLQPKQAINIYGHPIGDVYYALCLKLHKLPDTPFMLHRFFIITLILLFANQTVAFMYDTHEAHQAGDDHLAFDSDHSDHHAQDDDAQSHSDGTVDYDCHHCCHCHGSTPLGASNKNVADNPLSITNDYPRVTEFQSGLQLSPDHRPPIA